MEIQKMEKRMKKITTLFAAFAVAVVFGFLLSASPPTFAAEKQDNSIEKNMKVSIVGEPSVGTSAAFEIIASKLAEKGISAAVVADFHEETIEDVAPSLALLRNHALTIDPGITLKDSYCSIARAVKLEKFERINYESPPGKFFTGASLDTQARGKI